MTYTESFAIEFKPIAHPKAVVAAPQARFTVLTPRLLRMEYHPTEAFEDRPSQAFWYRQQPPPDFQVQRLADRVEIETSHLRLVYHPGPEGFAPHTLSVALKQLDHTWRYGDADPDNLLGTARTLDQAHGAVQLEPGPISRSGWAVVDDGQRLVFDAHGWLTPRETHASAQDLYFFGYGQDYGACLQDYCKIAGQVPLLPRWVLGNWWSRYWAYSDAELLGLMQEFRDHDVPLSVCIVDMDWHITDTGNRSSGWTGYTWNRELFPDPPAFIASLHQLGLRTALNLHPALGVYPHEEQYAGMAKRMGIAPATQEPVPFDIADPEFTRAYFELLHHPYEAQGIDFWWLDWQQGTESTVSGLDPLWWLNHLHFHDLARDGDKRPFIFSRWGGLGNHRYPIGFSGDTVVSWESLAFQPYFTATAANVGYGWWSHDIGGHMGGIEDPELFARWVQYGVFSPIFRLHCTKNPLHERRPWGYDAETHRVTRQAMQLRHALIPYLYTMSWQHHRTSLPPFRPMYYDHPAHEQAYHCPDQYTFGSELLAAPFITPADAETRLSRQVVWLPPGQWFGMFNGLSYPGDGWYAIHGAMDEIPVFAKAGAILPLRPQVGWGGVETPDALEIHVFPGADNRFELYEDDGLSAYSLTPLHQTWTPQQLRFEIDAAQGESAHLPEQRDYTLLFRSIANGAVAVEKNGTAIKYTTTYDAETSTLKVNSVTLTPADTLTVTITTEQDSLLALRDHRLPSCRQILRACRLDSWVKQSLDGRLTAILAHPHTLGDYELALSDGILRALFETITAAGAHRAPDPASGGTRVILWNNQSSEGLTFKFVGIPLAGTSAVKRTGDVPKFVAFMQRDDRLQTVIGAGPRKIDSVVGWLDDLQQGFREETAGDLDMVVQFNIAGDDGLQAYMHISGGALTVAAGLHEHPDLAVDTDGPSWLALINGQASPDELFLSGKLQVSGDLTLAMRLADLLGGHDEQTRFRAAPWKLSIDYFETPLLELGTPQG